MHNGSMPNMCSLPQPDGDTREHMDHTIFLHVATILNDDSAPISPDRSTGPYVHIFTYDYISRDGGQRVNEAGRMYHRLKAFEFIKHDQNFWNCKLLRGSIGQLPLINPEPIFLLS
jgi:hypothetical protein